MFINTQSDLPDLTFKLYAILIPYSGVFRGITSRVDVSLKVAYFNQLLSVETV